MEPSGRELRFVRSEDITDCTFSFGTGGDDDDVTFLSGIEMEPIKSSSPLGYVASDSLSVCGPEFLALKQESRILQPCMWFLHDVRLCAVWPMENWLCSSLNQIQGWTTLRESYTCALEQGPLVRTVDTGCLARTIGEAAVVKRAATPHPGIRTTKTPISRIP